MKIYTAESNQSDLSHKHSHWKGYLIMLFAIVGIAVMVGMIYSNSPKYKEEMPEALVPSPTTTAVPLIQEAYMKQIELQQDSLAEPANIKHLRELARKYILTEDFDKAIATYLQEIDLQPNNPSVHRELGNAYIQSGKVEDAIASYEKSIELDPKENASFSELADIFSIHMPDQNKVIQTYTQATATNPTNTTFRILFASFYEQINEKELALQQYRNVLTIDPTNDIALKKVAQLQ